MTKKRKSQSTKAEPKARPKAKWSEPIVVQLLAWLDVTIQNSDISFEETIEGQLHKKCGVEYTYTQVTRKLKKLWSDYGRLDSDLYQDLLNEGHLCLIGLSQEEHLEIEAAVREYEVGLRTISQTPRRLTRQTSTSIGDATRPRANISKRLKQEEKRSSFHNSARQTPTPNSSQLDVRNIGHTPDSRSRASKRLKVYGKGKSGTRLHTLTRDTIELRSQSSTIAEDSQDECLEGWERSESRDTCSELPDPKRCQLAIPEPATSEEEVKCICGATDEVLNWTKCNKCETWQHNLCVQAQYPQLLRAQEGNYLCPSCSSGSATDCKVVHQSSQTIEYIPNHFDDMRLELAMQQVQSLEANVNDHVARLRDCEEERDEFENQVRLLESNSKSMQRHPMDYLLNQRDREIARLSGELEDFRSLSRFARLDAASQELFEPNIIQGFVELFSMSEQILCERRRCNLTTMQHHGQHKKLHDIACHVFTHSDASEEVAQSLLTKFSELDSAVALRALTSSLLIKWVFETNYPCIEDSSAEYRDVAKLRNILLMKGGVLASRNLDLTLRHTLIKDQDFHHRFIEPRAKHLAIEYSQVLEPLFAQEDGDALPKSWDGFNTWNDDMDTWKDRQNRLQCLFELALRTKADSTINLKDYESVTIAPGTPFDAQTMKAENWNGVATDSKHAGRLVELCLQPAIYIYPKTRLSEDDSESATVSSTNFVRKTAQQRLQFRPSMKAVVILRGDQESISDSDPSKHMALSD